MKPGPRQTEPARSPVLVRSRWEFARPRLHRGRTATQSAALAAILAVVYIRTLLPTVGYSGDTAKFDFVGYVLGVPHPPGYPTYVVANHLFTHLLPLGSVAWRANLLSALFAVAAVVVVNRTLGRLGVRPVLAFAAALGYGLSLTFWSQAVVAEVYSLTILFMAAGIHFLVRWNQSRSDVDLIAAVAVFATSLGHSLSVYLLGPGLLAFVLATDHRRLLRRKVLVATAVLVALGFAQYGYVAWRTFDPSTAFLESRITGVRSFLAAITGSGFRSLMWQYGPVALWEERLPMFARLVWREWLVLLPVAAYGAVRLGRNPLNLLLGLAAITVTVFGLEYAIPDVEVTFIPLYFFIAIWIGVGLEGLARRLRGRWVQAAAVALLIPVGFGAANLGTVDRSKATATAHAAEEALAAMPDGSVVFSPSFAQYMYFAYYVIGQDLEDRHHIYAYPYTTQEMPVAAYCRGETFLDLWTERRTLRPGLSVFVHGDRFATDLSLHGLVTTRVADQLYAVACPDLQAG